MKHKLFWKLFLNITIVAVLLVYFVKVLDEYVESEMTWVSDVHKSKLLDYRDQADALIKQGDKEAANQWLTNLQNKESTFATIIRTEEVLLLETTPTQLPFNYLSSLHQEIDWKIHLDHSNRIIKLPLSMPNTNLLIRLPTYMLPGKYWQEAHVILHFLFPLILMTLVTLTLYRQLMTPIKLLESATHSFAEGKLDYRVKPLLGKRDDELGRLASNFDNMAERIQSLIQDQRYLINDLSHELRTPLQRIELSLSRGNLDIDRIKRETQSIKQLVEDTLSLAWLQNESPNLRTQTLDIISLLDAIIDDARFEYPDNQIVLHSPDELMIWNSSEKALNLSLENIIRNALRHSPPQGVVTIEAKVQQDLISIDIKDEGEGVAEQYLEMIFKPFFRIDSARGRDSGGIGLGLALTKRQIEKMGGNILASSRQPTGLSMHITLPQQ